MFYFPFLSAVTSHCIQIVSQNWVTALDRCKHYAAGFWVMAPWASFALVSLVWSPSPSLLLLWPFAGQWSHLACLRESAPRAEGPVNPGACMVGKPSPSTASSWLWKANDEMNGRSCNQLSCLCCSLSHFRLSYIPNKVLPATGEWRLQGRLAQITGSTDPRLLSVNVFLLCAAWMFACTWGSVCQADRGAVMLSLDKTFW